MRGWLEQRWFALGPAAVSLGLGLWAIGTPGPWLDEMFTIEAIMDGLATHLWDAPMLPYYAFMWLWSAGGTFVDIGWLRLPSIIAVVAAVYLVALTGRHLATSRAAFVAGMVLALAPGISRYAHEARTYALALALVSGATLALVKVIESNRTRTWVAYSVLLGAAALLLPVSLAVLPAHAVLLMGTRRPRPWRRWAVSIYVLLPVVALEAGFALIFSQTRDWLASPTVRSLLDVSALLVASEYTSAAYGLAVLIIGVTSAMGRRWVLALLASVALVWIVSMTVSNWWLARGFVPLAGIACVAAGVSTARMGWGWIAGILAALAVLSAPDHVAIREPLARGVDPELIAEIVGKEGSAGDVVVAASGRSHPWWSVVHYLQDDEIHFTRMPSPPASGRFWQLAEEPPCAMARSWRVAPDRQLWLCEPPSSANELDGGPNRQSGEKRSGQ